MFKWFKTKPTNIELRNNGVLNPLIKETRKLVPKGIVHRPQGKSFSLKPKRQVYHREVPNSRKNNTNLFNKININRSKNINSNIEEKATKITALARGKLARLKVNKIKNKLNNNISQKLQYKRDLLGWRKTQTKKLTNEALDKALAELRKERRQSIVNTFIKKKTEQKLRAPINNRNIQYLINNPDKN
jgi:hypothetical protein